MDVELFTGSWKVSSSGGLRLPVMACSEPAENRGSWFWKGPKNDHTQASRFFPLGM